MEVNAWGTRPAFSLNRRAASRLRFSDSLESFDLFFGCALLRAGGTRGEVTARRSAERALEHGDERTRAGVTEIESYIRPRLICRQQLQSTKQTQALAPFAKRHTGLRSKKAFDGARARPYSFGDRFERRRVARIRREQFRDALCARLGGTGKL